MKHTMSRIGTGKTHTTLAIDEQRAHLSAQIDEFVLRGMRKSIEGAIGKTSATEDIVNETIVVMLEKADSFNWTRGTVGAWAMRIAANRARNWRKMACNRKTHVSEVVDPADGESTCDVFETVSDSGMEDRQRKIDAEALRAAIDSLDDDSRQFLSWVEKEGVTQTAAGQLFGWSPATATRRMKDIAKRTRARFDGSF
jgi:RNA polymerase sigma factor (sigma-70 family)